MTLASGAHIALGEFADGDTGTAATVPLELILAQDVEPHYNHRFEQSLTGRAEVPGEAGKFQTNPGRLFWSQTDWSGGEGTEYWDPNDPPVYVCSTPETAGSAANVRKIGQLTGRPNREQSSGIPAKTTTTNRPVYLCMGGGLLWLGAEERIAFSSDYGASFTAITGNEGINAADRVFSMAGDGKHIYYCSGTTTGSTREINRYKAFGIAAGDNATQVLADGVGATDGTNTFTFVGMAICMGKLYGWTGARLWEVDISGHNSDTDGSFLPINEGTDTDYYRLVHNAKNSLDVALLGKGNTYGSGAWYADIKETENSVVYFTASEGVTDVFEFKPVSARPAPILRLPLGFTARSMIVQNGIVFFAGQFGNANSGTDEYGGIYAMDLATRKVFFINHFRKLKGESLLMHEMANSFGSQILIGSTKGKIFVYDMETDGISLLDDLAISAQNGDTEGDLTTAFNSNSRTTALLTVGNKRLAAYYPTTGSPDSWGVVNYQNDEPVNREASGDIETHLQSSSWDFGYPFEAKGLLGFWVTWKREDHASPTTSGLLQNQRIKISYALDADSLTPTWTHTTTLDYQSTPTGARGRAYVQVAAAGTAPTAPFVNMQYRIQADNTDVSGVKPPIVTGLAVEASLVANVEVWDLVVRVADEPRSGPGRSKPGHRQWKGTQIRNYLEDLAQNKAAITFKDGYRDKTPGQFTTHTVVIEEAEDAITNAGEGAMRLKLKAVLST